jgi:RNA polymerase sigma factor (sigma-70 family)
VPWTSDAEFEELDPAERFEKTENFPRWVARRIYHGLRRSGFEIYARWSFLEQSAFIGHWNACVKWRIDGGTKFLNYARRRITDQVWEDLRNEFSRYGRGFLKNIQHVEEDQRYRTPRTRAVLVHVDEIPWHEPALASDPDRPRIGAAVVRSIVLGLAPEARRLLSLYFGEGWTLEQVARLEGSSESTVHRRLEAVLREIRRGLGIGVTGRPFEPWRWTSPKRRWTRDELRAEPPPVHGPLPKKRPKRRRANAVRRWGRVDEEVE